MNKEQIEFYKKWKEQKLSEQNKKDEDRIKNLKISVKDMKINTYKVEVRYKIRRNDKIWVVCEEYEPDDFYTKYSDITISKIYKPELSDLLTVVYLDGILREE